MKTLQHESFIRFFRAEQSQLRDIPTRGHNKVKRAVHEITIEH